MVYGQSGHPTSYIGCRFDCHSFRNVWLFVHQTHGNGDNTAGRHIRENPTKRQAVIGGAC